MKPLEELLEKGKLLRKVSRLSGEDRALFYSGCAGARKEYFVKKYGELK